MGVVRYSKPALIVLPISEGSLLEKPFINGGWEGLGVKAAALAARKCREGLGEAAAPSKILYLMSEFLTAKSANTLVAAMYWMCHCEHCN